MIVATGKGLESIEQGIYPIKKLSKRKRMNKKATDFPVFLPRIVWLIIMTVTLEVEISDCTSVTLLTF